jgi:serine protease inhibitor
MKKLLAVIALALLAALPAASFADAQDLIPPYHWTYHALADLSQAGLVNEAVEPGKSAFTPEQVVSLIVFAMNRAQADPLRLREPQLQDLRQLINGYRADLEKAGQKPNQLLSDLESYAAQAGLPPLTTGTDEGKKLSEAAARSVNEFACDLYKKLAGAKGSLFLSPYSVSSALCMTYAGARGQTAAEMEKVLRATPDVHRYMGALVNEINAVPKDTAAVSVASAIWPAAGTKLLPEFVQTVRDGYAAGVAPLDYKASASKAAKVINNWVSKHTNDKIKEIVNAGVLNKNTQLVLTNAVYFKSQWAHKFEPGDTRVQPFRISDAKTVRLPLMYEEGRFRYAKTDNAAIAELPYKNGRFSMLVLLPDKKTDLSALELRLSAASLDKWTSGLRERLLDLYLPKFRTESSFELSKTLAALGMPSAFGSGADFTGMNGTGGLSIGSVLHKTFVDVTEDGTEAAAATAVVMLTSAAPSQERPLEFRADRPFIYIIKDCRSGAIIFIGRYSGK